MSTGEYLARQEANRLRNQLASLPRPQLEALRARLDIGPEYRAHIDAALAGTPEMGRAQSAAKNEVAPKSTDPRDRMNMTERRMDDVLQARKRAGEIRDFWYEAIAFRVGLGRSVYRPDFVCRLPDGSLEVIEVKGKHIWDDAKKAFKAAALLYPFARWRMVQWADGEWRTLYDFARDNVDQAV